MASCSSSSSPGTCQGTLGDLILHSLEDLGEYDFKKFKNKLSDYSFENKLPIPRGRLEKTDYVTTKDLLVDTYGEEGALDVVIQVLTLISLLRPASDLQERRGQNAKWSKTVHANRLTELRKQYMESVRKKFQRTKEHNSRMGESVNLQVKYTPLLMREGHPDKQDKEQEIAYKGKGLIHTMEQKPSEEYSPTTLHALFDPDKDGNIPKVVVLHGPTGIGKTWTSMIIMLDWALGNLYREKFDFVFYLSCRELNTITGKTSLVKLLSRTSSLRSDDLHFVLKDDGNHDRLLFVIDGFDELSWTLQEKARDCDDLSEETHIETLLRSVLRKQVLEQSSLIITSRSLEQKKLQKLIDDLRYVEVKGFSDGDRRNYFNNSFKNGADAEKILRVIEGNNILFVMCSVPLLCWILSTVLRQEIKKGLDLIRTTTSIYLLYLEGLMIHHGRNQPIHACLKKLCALAKEGVLNQQILFQEKDLERHGLSVSEVESVFLNENIFHVSIKSQTCYSFIHLSVQEFLAALYYVLDDGDEQVGEEALLPEICKGGSLPDLCDQHPHLSMAVRFLFGLLYEKQVSEFSESTGCKISLRVRSAMEEWITGDTARSALGEWMSQSILSVDVISCLYETQNEDLIRRALPHSSCLTLNRLWQCAQKNMNDIKQLCYCLKLCECPLTLYICNDTIYSEESKIFSPLLHKCQQLWFNSCHFHQRRTPEPTKGLPSLGLSWLINPQSKIQELSLHQCYLTTLSCNDLRYAIVNPSLTKLDLSFNHLEDSEIKILCEGLRDPGCTLKELSLCGCDLSHLCCDELRAALLSNQSLTKLDLSGNCNIKDSGAKLLFMALRHQSCALQKLSLSDCQLSHMCCDDLSSALIRNRSLTKLDISHNPLKDSGVKRLCEGLRDPHCTLQKISMQVCRLSPLCCDELRSILVTNRSLIKMDLSQNYLKDSGVKRLCKGLRYEGCTLQKLSLQQCRLSRFCCDDLRSVLATNQSLTKLDLSENHLRDSGVKLLCKGLVDSGCKLQDLRLSQCHLTSVCCDDIRSALVKKQSFIKLDLSNNQLEDSGVKTLCEGLKDPGCSLQELWLYGCQSMLSCCEDLCSVISTNQSLTRLEIILLIDNKEITETEVNNWAEKFQRLGCQDVRCSADMIMISRLFVERRHTQ